jgi:hypothetical protein
MIIDRHTYLRDEREFKRNANIVGGTRNQIAQALRIGGVSALVVWCRG